jgi:hypothetical protein
MFAIHLIEKLEFPAPLNKYIMNEIELRGNRTLNKQKGCDTMPHPLKDVYKN